MPSPRFDFDTNRLAGYLARHIDGFRGPLTAEKFDGGQSNPTFRLDTPNGRYVLRRKPPGKLLKSAHAVDREFRVMAALADTPVPVPRVHHLCTDDSIIGSMFFVMEYIDGRVHWDPKLEEVDDSTRAGIYAEMIGVLTAVHSVDTDAAGLADYGRPGNYFARQVARWSKQYRASETMRIDEMEQLMDWLAANLPDDDGRVALVHGDYRLDNLVFHRNAPTVLAVLDWELSTLGHPFADLAYLCMQLRIGRDGLIPGLGGVDREALCIPSEAAMVDSYCARMGIDGIGQWNFYVALSFFRLAAILQGVGKRAQSGNASNPRAAALGEAVRPLARMAVELF